MDYVYVALAAAFFLCSLWVFAVEDSAKGLLTFSVLGVACIYDVFPHDLPRGVVTGGAFVLVVVTWIVGFVVVFERQRRQRRRELV